MTARTIDTGTDDLRAEVEDGVAVLTLNRPERRNALSDAMLAGLDAALAHAETAQDVGAVLLTGAGGAFCAGGDVKGFAERGGEGGGTTTPYDVRVQAQRLSQRGTAGRLFHMAKPCLAVLPGAAAGAGLSLALACDLRIAADTAVLTTAFAKVGFSGDYGGTWFLSHLVGTAKARELYYLSERVTAAQALQLGLVSWVVPADELTGRASELARRLASGPTVAYRYMKENLNRALVADLDDCMDLEATHHIHCGTTEDHRNAVQAFVAKTEPVFTGR